jgi:hypothetical protein
MYLKINPMKKKSSPKGQVLKQQLFGVNRYVEVQTETLMNPNNFTATFASGDSRS